MKEILDSNDNKKNNQQKKETPVVNCELLTDALMRDKLKPIIEYIKAGDPDINVVLAELEEITLRSTGEYFKTNRCNSK